MAAPAYEVLEAPIKSPNDHKSYRVIKLANGLRALLISDIACTISSEEVVRNRNFVDIRIERFNKEVLGLPPDPSSCGKVPPPNPKPDVSNRAHAPDCKCSVEQAAVALSVGVGNFSDPPHLLGLAHYTEHMIFCGTAEFPDPEAFDLFVTSNCGFSNATTYGESTLFYFHVDQGKLEEALVMFGAFFREPLMAEEYVQKEMSVLDLEFNEKKCLDSEKRAQLLLNAGKKGHGVTQFGWGTKDTLVMPPGSSETVYSELHKFRNQHYGSEGMNLSIQASEPLDVLQDLILEYFGDIPRSTVPKPVRPEEPLPFDTPEFRRFFSVVPTQDCNLLFVTWELPAEAGQAYDSKPLSYIQRMIANENKGGLVACLRGMNLITSCECQVGATVNNHERTNYSVLLTVSFQLTSTELKDVISVLKGLFSFLKFSLSIEPQKWFFQEFNTIRATEFHYLDEMVACESTVLTAEALRRYGPKDCLIADLLVTKWEPQLITRYLNLLTPDRANFMLMSQANQKICNLMEPFFQTPYSVEVLPPALMKKLQEIGIYEEFSMYGRNQFLTTSFFTVEDVVGRTDDTVPVRVVANEKIEMWHLLDTTECRTEFFLLFRTAFHRTDPGKFVSLSLLVAILDRVLESRLFCAREAKLEYSVARDHQGIRVHVAGFSQKLPYLLLEVTRSFGLLPELVTESLFRSEKMVQGKRLKNAFRQPELLARHVRARIVSSACYSPVEMYEALQGVTYGEFLGFCEELKGKMFTLGLSYGNLSREAAIKMATEIVSTLDYDECEGPEGFGVLTKELPVGEKILRLETMNPGNNSSVITSFYQAGAVDLKSSLVARLLTNLIREHAFQELRVDKNLGYKVEVFYHLDVASSVGVIFNVTSQSDKFPGSEVKAAMDTFIEDFYTRKIEPMSSDELEDLKGTFEFTSVDRTRESGKRFFLELVKQDYCFRRGSLEMDLMEDVTVEDVQIWYEEYLLPNAPGLRKLDLQVVGPADTEYPVRVIQAPGAETPYPLVALIKEGAPDIIGNIQEFHDSLPTLPKNSLT